MAEYINFPSGFNVTTTLPVDKRMIMTKAEMLAVKKAQMPDYYLVYCSDDNKFYVYDKSIETPSEELGRFRHLEDLLSFTSDAAKAQFEAAIENSTKIQDLSTKVGDAETAGSLVYNVNQLQTNVTNISGRVDTLETNVTNLETTVGDDDSGLIKKVKQLGDDVETLDADVDQAQEDITVIQTWINHVKLDGGEIKATYTITDTLTNVTAGSEERAIAYNGSGSYTYTADSGYTLPEIIKVNDIEVSSEKVSCETVDAQWDKSTGTLSLSNATNDITVKIEAKAE